jgi:predicted DNA-binding transcriptional regulator AlpA
LIDIERVMDKLAIGNRSTVWRKVRDGSLPAPVSTGPNSRRWFEDEIDAVMASLPRVAYKPKSAA